MEVDVQLLDARRVLLVLLLLLLQLVLRRGLDDDLRQKRCTLVVTRDKIIFSGGT